MQKSQEQWGLQELTGRAVQQQQAGCAIHENTAQIHRRTTAVLSIEKIVQCNIYKMPIEYDEYTNINCWDIGIYCTGKSCTNKEWDRGIHSHDVHQLNNSPYSKPVFRTRASGIMHRYSVSNYSLHGINLPHSTYNWYYDQCNQWSEIPQSIRLQGSHSVMEAEVIWHIQSQSASNAGHLYKNDHLWACQGYSNTCQGTKYVTLSINRCTNN